MKKETVCQECSKISETNYYCDNCGVNLMTACLGIPITISFSYGSSLDGETYEFCSLEHLQEFILNEIKKQNPENRFIYGGENA
jgi:YHS domain-containing protein